MNRLFTVIISFLLFSYNSGQKTKIIDKWENGKNKTVVIYDNPNDILTYLREFYYENGKIGTKATVNTTFVIGGFS